MLTEERSKAYGQVVQKLEDAAAQHSSYRNGSARRLDRVDQPVRYRVWIMLASDRLWQYDSAHL